MGYKSLQIKLPTNYTDDDIRQMIKKQLGTGDFNFQIEKKSLDARKKNDIHWLIGLIVSSNLFPGDEFPARESIHIPYRNRKEKIAVVGSGPAGFFAAYVLQSAGYQVSIIERGSEVKERSLSIRALESEGKFSSQNNYAFGEGGAGTFSDGKLTSRSKRISAERSFILSEYVKAGAPEEILYMAHPHVGTDKLKKIVVNLRASFLEKGGQFLFNNQLLDIAIRGGKLEKIMCSDGEFEPDILILATGHSAYDTYRMLLKRGLIFGTKNFAIGHRIEHPQTLINKAQWGYDSLPGVKAAEYRLATKTKSGIPVYSFCMCPGGMVVPAAAFEQKSVVNGMSYYLRNGKFANAGIVAGVHPDMLLGHTCTPLEILDWMDKLEEKFFDFSKNYVVPANHASNYIKKTTSGKLPEGSYPLGMQISTLFDMVPGFISNSIAEGLRDFSNKIKGFDHGILMGLESKTSSPIQVAREKNGKCTGFDNVYFIGEGSGYAGGIISSAADGVRCALSIIEE